MKPIPAELGKMLKTLANVNVVNWNDRLWHDYRLRGGDVLELMEFLESRFGVDLNSIRWSEYFPDEGFSLRDAIAFLKSFPKTSRKVMTVGDLVEMIERVSGQPHPIAGSP